MSQTSTEIYLNSQVYSMREYTILRTVVLILHGATLLVVLMLAMFELATINAPHWNCSAKNEVVTTKNTCVHIDTLQGEGISR